MTIKDPPRPGIVVLQKCIEPAGLSITDATAALGVTRNTLSELVNERRCTSPEMAVRLSKVFVGTEQGWVVQQLLKTLVKLESRVEAKISRPEAERQGSSESGSAIASNNWWLSWLEALKESPANTG